MSKIRKDQDSLYLKVVEDYTLEDAAKSGSVSFRCASGIWIRKGDIKHVREVVNTQTRKPYRSLSGIVTYDNIYHVVKGNPSLLWDKVNKANPPTGLEYRCVVGFGRGNKRN